MDDVLERDLITRLRGGDGAAFDEIYERLRTRIHGFLARMTGRGDLADDLSQEVWLRLARTAPRLAPDTRIKAWLFTVARNLYISHWRADQVARQLGGDLLPPAPAPPSPFEAAAETQTQRLVEAVVARLPAPYREILLLCSVEGMSPGEAAAVLGISPEAARQRLSRARARVTAGLDAFDALGTLGRGGPAGYTPGGST